MSESVTFSRLDASFIKPTSRTLAFLPLPRKRPALEIECDLLECKCGRAEQSIELGAAVRPIFHDEGVVLTEIGVPKMHCRYSHGFEPNVTS